MAGEELDLFAAALEIYGQEVREERDRAALDFAWRALQAGAIDSIQLHKGGDVTITRPGEDTAAPPQTTPPSAG